MQFVILIYRYFHGSKALEIYEIVRLLVTSYLFMTEFGHTIYFLNRDDYSLKLVASVLIRLNMLTCTLTYMMRTDYLFYYFPPLASFWFLVVYFVLKIGRHQNSNTYFLTGKLFLSAVLTTAFTMIPEVMEFVALILRYTCATSWNMKELRFRLFLDMYIVYFGMLFAVLYHRAFSLKSGSAPSRTVIDSILDLTIAYNRMFKMILLIISLILLAGFWVLTRRSPDKEDYNWWHPYISFIPILCFVLLRNSYRILRNYHSTAFAWLGRISLETYVLQYHTWMAGDTKGLLRLGLFNRWVEAAILTALFIWISWHTEDATRRLTSCIVDGSSPRPNHMRGEDVEESKNSPYLLPRSADGEAAAIKEVSFEADRGRLASCIARVVVEVREDLRWRLGLIGFFMWLGNVTYR